MRHPKHAAVVRTFAVAFTLLAVLAAVACSPPTGAERVAQQRAEYSAQLNSFTVLETPVEPAMEEPMADDAMADDEAMEEDAMADGEEMAGELTMPEVRQDVMLDVVLEKQGRSDGLDGVTVDVYQVDASETEKARYKIYVETGGLVNGSSIQTTHVLEDVDYTEGDGFIAEVRQNIDPGSRSDYREFNDAADGG
jgi:hypothetical protein